MSRSTFNSFDVNDEMLAWFQDYLKEQVDHNIRIRDNNDHFELNYLENKIIFSKQNTAFIDTVILQDDTSGEFYVESWSIDPEFTHAGNWYWFDFIGFSIWTLLREEESHIKNRDNHQRIQLTDLHAYKFGYYQHPLIDIFLNRILNIIGVARKSKQKFEFTQDLDVPSIYVCGNFQERIKNIKMILYIFIENLFLYLRLKRISHFSQLDRHYNFWWILKTLRDFDIHGILFILQDIKYSKFNRSYSLNNRLIVRIIKKYQNSKFKIGLHPGYYSSSNGQTVQRCLDKFSSHNDIDSSISRMHYLRITDLSILSRLARSGVKHEYSMGFAEAPGFRAGTCHAYRFFDVFENKQTDMYIHPLIFMECSAAEDRYLALGYGDRLVDLAYKLQHRCNKVNGTFSLLWHNCRLVSLEQQDCFKKVLKRCLS